MPIALKVQIVLLRARNNVTCCVILPDAIFMVLTLKCREATYVTRFVTMLRGFLNSLYILGTPPLYISIPEFF